MGEHKKTENLEYVNRGGTGLFLDLHFPATSSGPLPVVVGLPGGGWRGCSKESVPPFLLDHGFAMACINYRVSSNAIAPANIQDCKAAVSWVRANAQRYGLNPARIGVYGASAGGHLAALLGASTGVKELEGSDGKLLSPSAAVQAVCAVCGPMDLTRIAIPEVRSRFPVLYEVTEQYLGGPVAERAELARLVSPLSYASKQCPPTLLIHGAADPTVPVEESIIYHEALQKVGARCSLRVIDGAGHGWLHEKTGDLIGLFFNEILR